MFRVCPSRKEEKPRARELSALACVRTVSTVRRHISSLRGSDNIMLSISSRFLAPLLFQLPTSRPRGNTVLIQGSKSLDEQADLIQGFRERIQECNLAGPFSVPFFVGNAQAGEVAAKILPALKLHPDVLDVSDSDVRLVSPLVDASVEERTAAMERVTASIREAGLVKGWRDELLSLATSFDAPPCLLIERACLPLFGGKGYGVFVNGYSLEPSTGEPHLWVATRSLSKPTWPGMLDAVVGGALSAGMSPTDTVIKEAAEEAGVPFELALQSKPCSCCSYRGTDESGFLKRDVLFCYDLELPWDFLPSAVDGEVESFERLPLTRVAEAVAFGKPAAFKPNINLVIIDYLIRQGFLSPDAPGYLQLVAELRSGDCR